MAIGTATAIIGGVSLAASGFQMINGMKETRQAKNAAENFERQDLNNVFQDMPISTLGSDLMREESGRTNASLVDASMSGGIRGVLGALPKIQAQTNNQNRQAQVELDGQFQDRNRLIANDNVRIQSMQEQRDNQELAGIGARIQAGREDTFNGIRGAANAISFAGANLENSRLPGEATGMEGEKVSTTAMGLSDGIGGLGNSFNSMPGIGRQAPSFIDYLNEQRRRQQNSYMYPNSNGLG
jgi:hypothetical protein